MYVTSDLLHLRSVCRDSRHVFGSLGILGGIWGERRINELLFSLVIGSRMCLACHVYVVRASVVKRKGGSGRKKIEGTTAQLSNRKGNGENLFLTLEGFFCGRRGEEGAGTVVLYVCRYKGGGRGGFGTRPGSSIKRGRGLSRPKSLSAVARSSSSEERPSKWKSNKEGRKASQRVAARGKGGGGGKKRSWEHLSL